MNSFTLPPNVLELRRLLQDKFPEAHAAAASADPVWPTQVPCLNAAGLCRGTITEIVGPGKSCGTGLLITALVENPGTIQQPVVLIDGCDAFDPASITPAARARLLWLRCRSLNSATQAADLLLRDGNMPLILLDLQLCPARQLLSLPSSIWHRLRFLAEKSSAALCVFTPCRVITCARGRLILEQSLTLAEMERPQAELVRGLQAQVERGSRAGMPGLQVALAN